jgi:hypothetical protein
MRERRYYVVAVMSSADLLVRMVFLRSVVLAAVPGVAGVWVGGVWL